MDLFQFSPVLAIFLLVALILKPIAHYTKIPYPTLLVIAGLVVSELLVWQGFDTGLRWDNFNGLVFYGLLPLLIYDAAFRLNAQGFFENSVTILLLAIPFMLLATFITAGLLYVGIGNASGFPWVSALITAAIISAIDPSAILAMLKQSHLPNKITSLLEGEGLLSGAMAFVLLALLSVVSLQGNETLSFVTGILLFVKVFTGGIAIGLFLGLLSWLLFSLTRNPIFRGIFSLLSAYSSFIIAEYYLHVSGVIAVLLAGLMLNAFTQKTDKPTKMFLSTLWYYQSTLASTLLFLLLGVSIQLALLADQWLAILIGIAAALIARFLLVFFALSLACFLPTVAKLSFRYQLLLFWGGLRGAVTVALVLSLPATLEGFYTIQGIVYGVVIFTLFIQAPSLLLLSQPPSHQTNNMLPQEK